MKLSVLFLSVLLTFLYLGCTDSNINNPSSTQERFSPLVLPARTASLSVEDDITASQEINGSTGGALLSAESYQGVSGEVNMDMKLVIPPGTFPETQTVSVSLDGLYAIFKFSPEVDYQATGDPILFSCTFSGMDLSSELIYDFVYIDAEGNIQSCLYSSIIVDVANGTLTVVDAQITNYDPDSRYGWATRTPPPPEH